MKNVSIAILTLLTVSACSSTPGQNQDSSSSSVSSSLSSERTIRETKNVSYNGVVRPAGISIFMEGTHRLSLQDGRFILLESDSLDLNGYVGESVEVFGSTRPTIESDALIMSVSEIQMTSSSEELESSVSRTSLASTKESSTSHSTQSSQLSSPASSTSISISTVELTESLNAKIELMAKEKLDPALWTRTYCTGHIGFCVPVHKNWYYQSFGATSSEFWHVEMSTEALEKIHDGPLSVRLVEGSLASLGATDGQVVREGNTVIGYRSWTDGRHFEVVADSRLDASVRYVTNELEVYVED